MFTASFSQALKRGRAAAGLSQRELATLAGVTQSRISDYEQGIRSPSLERAERLLNLVGRDIVIESRRLDRHDRELLALTRALSPRQRLDQSVALARLRGLAAPG